MSELIQANNSRAIIRWELLTGASALVLVACVASIGVADAEDADRPLVWIELGGQLSRLSDGQEVFAPSLFDSRPSIFSPSQNFEKPPFYSVDEYGAISIQPENSNWVFSADVRYGRSVSHKHVHQQTYPKPAQKYTDSPYYRSALAARFADTDSRNSETHLVLDFQAGRDIGLGLFGSQSGSSVVSVGVRFVQFNSRTSTVLKSDPDWHFNYFYSGGRKFLSPYQLYHSNYAAMSAQRSFHGVGPSISWNASEPVMGNPQASELTFDWGLNAALLFGRQRAKIHHQTTGQYHFYITRHRTTPTQLSTNHTRTRTVTVPNVGGFAALSFRYAEAKISFGYRADFFFGAMDGGIDVRKSEDVGFHGPFATVSIGLGG